MSQTKRAWLYRGLTFVLAVLAGYDIVADSAVPLWAALGAAVLGTSVAAANTPTKPAGS